MFLETYFDILILSDKFTPFIVKIIPYMYVYALVNILTVALPSWFFFYSINLSWIKLFKQNIIPESMLKVVGTFET